MNIGQVLAFIRSANGESSAAEALAAAEDALEAAGAATEAAEAAQEAAAAFTVDEEIDADSEHAVQNKVIKAALDSVNSSISGLEDDVDAVEEEITALQGDLSYIGEALMEPVEVASKSTGTEDLPEGFTLVAGKYITSMAGANPGNLAGSGAKNNTFYMQAAEDMDVYLTNFGYGTSRHICVFAGEPYGKANRVTAVFASNTENYPMPTRDNPVHVEAGQYITFSYYNGATLANMGWTLNKVVPSEYKLKSTTPLTDEMSADVDARIKAETDSLNADNGYQYLGGTWSRGEWDSWSGHTSRTYRVRRNEAISWDRDVMLLSRPGFTFMGIIEGGGTFSGDRNWYKLNANTTVKISVRRQIEDGEETADVDVFKEGIVVASLMSPINLYAPTFTDVSMFERMGVCGDSYAGGGGIISGIRPLTWGKNLERQAGITVDIYAKSGQNVMQWLTAANGLPALLEGEECGLYWMQHGINGTGTAELLGTAADMGVTTDTFYGAYAYAVQQVQAAFPYARIVLATICGSDYGLYGTTYKNVNTAIKAIAEYCEVPCIDIIEDDFFRSPFYSGWSASNHPTAAVAAGMAMAHRRLISKCIRDNKNYFLRYGNRSSGGGSDDEEEEG